MNNKTEKRGVGKFIALLIILAVIVALFNPAWLTFLPEGTRSSIDTFIHTHYSESAVAGLDWMDIAAAVLTMFTAWVVANIAKFIHI